MRAGKSAAETISAMLAVFGRIDPHLRRSITFDNDTAFAQHALLRTMRDMTTWFCDAYASWQKGGIENANGRLRRWLPRHLDIDRTSDQDIQEIVLTTNLTPRKCLGFKTPFQALIAELGKDVQIRFSKHVTLHSGNSRLIERLPAYPVRPGGLSDPNRFFGTFRSAHSAFCPAQRRRLRRRNAIILPWSRADGASGVTGQGVSTPSKSISCLPSPQQGKTGQGSVLAAPYPAYSVITPGRTGQESK